LRISPKIRRIYSKGNAFEPVPQLWLAKKRAARLATRSLQHGDAGTPGAIGARRRGRGQPASGLRYGLRLLFENIEDSPHNETRFAVIGRMAVAQTKHDKTALMFKVFAQAGLAGRRPQSLQAEQDQSVWIESFPARTQKMEYVFFVDFEGHIDDPKVGKCLKTLQAQCEMLTVLGSFPTAPMSDD